MDARKLTIQSYGDLNRVIGVTRANVITNNVRRYATSRDYYTAASKAFGQVYSLMRGEQIAQPMKHFSNLCIALMLGLIVAMGKVFRHASSFRAPKPEDLIRYPESGILQDVYASYTHTERTYSPPSSSSDSSSGSSCSSCSSGGGSSCSSCGSGGSSSF